MKYLYLAGPDVRDLEEVFSYAYGVEETSIGMVTGIAPKAIVEYAKPIIPDPAQCVRVGFNPKKVDVTSIISLYFKLINPYLLHIDISKRTGVYYESGEDLMQIEMYFRFLQGRGGEPPTNGNSVILNDSYTPGVERRELLTELAKMKSFELAPENEQHYLAKHPEAAHKYDLAALRADGLIM